MRLNPDVRLVVPVIPSAHIYRLGRATYTTLGLASHVDGVSWHWYSLHRCNRSVFYEPRCDMEVLYTVIKSVPSIF